MNRLRILPFHLPRSLKLAGAALAIGICLALIVTLAMGIIRELRDLKAANSDNIQWVLAQTDVEYLQFALAIDAARAEQPKASSAALTDVRRRFDIFYSRIRTIEEGPAFARMRTLPGVREHLAKIEGFLQHTVPEIDAADQRLSAALDPLSASRGAIYAEVRGLSLAGLSDFARSSDLRRETVSVTLVRLGLLVLVLFGLLVVTTVSIFRLYRLSEQQRASQQVTAARLQTVINTALDAILVFGRDGRVQQSNPAAVRMFGTLTGAGGAVRMADLLLPEDARHIRPAQLAGQGRLTMQARRGDGTLFPVELAIEEAEASEGRIFVAFLRDISARVAGEAALTEARDRAMAGEKAKAEFLAVMSHEIRTPLNGLIGSLRLMQRTGLTDKQRDYVHNMDVSSRLLLSHVNNVLDISKFEAGKLVLERQAFRIDEMMDEIVASQRSMAEANGDAFGWRWEGAPLSPVLGAPARLRQVLINLVSNALKFTQNGVVSIEVEALGRSGARREVEFRVTDSGCGIAEADLERVFVDFETLDSSYGRNAGGTGLGLGIARRLVKAMGGEIGAESELGEGSLFWVRVPLEMDPGADRPEEMPVSPVLSRPLDLLVVEDNAINRLVLREMLMAEGHHVTEAENGAEGVRRAEQHRFDAILMDISMPVMDGPQAAREIRAGQGLSREIPIIAVTAHALPKEIEAFRAAGMSDCITKPVEPVELSRALARCCGGASPDGGQPAIEAEGQDALLADSAAQAEEDEAARGLLDPTQLHWLGSRLPPEQMEALMARYLAELDAALADLGSTDAGNGALPDLIALTHRTAGSASVLGLVALHRGLAEAERLGKAGEREAMIDALAALGEIWSASRPQLVSVAAQAYGDQRVGM